MNKSTHHKNCSLYTQNGPIEKKKFHEIIIITNRFLLHRKYNYYPNDNTLIDFLGINFI